MSLVIAYEVKFRALFITFGTVSGLRRVPLNIPAILKPQNLVSIKDRGVKIDVSLES